MKKREEKGLALEERDIEVILREEEKLPRARWGNGVEMGWDGMVDRPVH